MAAELLDRVDTLNHKVGTVERDTAHREGVWHRTVNFLVVDPEAGTTVFQNKKNKPVDEKFFVQINGGHLVAGETLEEGLREFGEEFGLELPASAFELVGVVPTCVDLATEFKIREFMYYYIVEVPGVRRHLENSFGVHSEAAAFVECGIAEGYALLVDESVDKIEGYNISTGGVTTVELTTDNFRNFTDDNLYARIFSRLVRYLQDPGNKMPL